MVYLNAQNFREVQYAYDFDNRLQRAEDDQGAVLGDYRYDALRRQVAKTVGTTETIYVCAGSQVLTEYESVSGAMLTPARSYIYGAYIDGERLRKPSW